MHRGVIRTWNERWVGPHSDLTYLPFGSPLKTIPYNEFACCS